ncbi:hypothetical protein NDU88_004791 [Pleurodeles waltl]|uniref:Uncharacterized protein n=1 Tax=Pleurodeles waltl TaxID=8319 RepID=A0AAV7LL41_PLEWA|nr:hypothetical protein NDU88_004791 [Pleurodeles waltl]
MSARNTDPEATSVPDIREQEGKGGGERRTARTGLTGRGAEPVEGENDSEAELGNGEEDLDKGREPDEEDSGKPRENSQRHHVPGGAWLSQRRRTARTGLTGRGAEPAEGENDLEAELGNREEDLDEDGEPDEEDSGKPRENS